MEQKNPLHVWGLWGYFGNHSMKHNITGTKLFRMLPILKALRRVRIHAHRADDISSALRFATEFNLDLRIEHCTEGHFIVEELSKHNLKVSVVFHSDTPF